MVGSPFQATSTSVLARFDTLITELGRLPLASGTGEQVLALMQELESRTRQLATADHRLIAEIDSLGLAADHGCRSTAALLRQALRISPREAADRVQAAADAGPRLGVTGDVLPPIYPRVAAAQADGSISVVHARIITATVDALPAAVQAEHDQDVEATLVEHARNFDPKLLAQLARRLSDTLNPDGTLTEERDRERRRDLRIRRRCDGSAGIEGELSALCAEAVHAVLEALAKPAPEADGGKDPRTPGQRQHDALHDAMNMLLRTNLLPECNGVAATILITMAADRAQAGDGLARTGSGAYISTKLALTLAGDARFVPVVLGKTRQITAYGSAHRLFTEGQRLAMIARDLGCSFPGCDQPPSRCQAHHITDFTLTWRTSVDDGTLLCGIHHREHPKLGWTCRLTNGVPHWTPPPWIDRTQTPRRNRLHDPLGV